jgi:hypothetical protein
MEESEKAAVARAAKLRKLTAEELCAMADKAEKWDGLVDIARANPAAALAELGQRGAMW